MAKISQICGQYSDGCAIKVHLCVFCQTVFPIIFTVRIVKEQNAGGWVTGSIRPVKKFPLAVPKVLLPGPGLTWSDLWKICWFNKNNTAQTENHGPVAPK